MRKRLLAALFGSFLLAGCLPKPTVLTMDQIRRMDYGSYPRNYEQLVKHHLAQTLIDPPFRDVRRLHPTAEIFARA